MNTLTITGVPAYDGTYEFEGFEDFTNRELHRIKKMTGLRVGELQDAWENSDNDVVVALAVVVLERNGKQVIDDLLWDAPAGTFMFDFADSEQEDPTQDGASHRNGDSVRKTDGSASSSGSSSDEPSDLLATAQSRTGDPT